MGTAIFYDAQNVRVNREGIERIGERIADSPLIDKIVMQRAYIVSSRSADYADLLTGLEEYGIDVVELEPQITRNGKAKPNQVDLKMCVDIPATILRRRSITTVVLVTGDGDFRFLIQTLKEHGRKVLLVSTAVNTANSLLLVCDDWIDLSDAPLGDRALLQIWRERMGPRDYRGQDALLALAAFLEDTAADPLLHRFLQGRMISASLLRCAFGQFVHLPDHKRLGYRQWIDLVESALAGTRFHLYMDHRRNQHGIELADKAADGDTYSPLQTYRRLSGVDDRYSPKRMRQWLKNLSRHSAKQLEELVFYVNLLQKNDMLQRNSQGQLQVPAPDNFADKLVHRLRGELRAAGCAIDEDDLQELRKLL